MRLEDTPETIRGMIASMLQTPVHKLALQVLDNVGSRARSSALERIPETVRELVRAEAIRVFELRQQAKKQQ